MRKPPTSPKPDLKPCGTAARATFPEQLRRRLRLAGGAAGRLTAAGTCGRVMRMQEVITIRLPKGTRSRLETRARAEKLTLSQYVRRALDAEELLSTFETARADLLRQARARAIYTDDDVFQIVS